MRHHAGVIAAGLTPAGGPRRDDKRLMSEALRRHRGAVADQAARFGSWLARRWGERPLKVYLTALTLASGLPILLFAGLVLVQLQAAHRDNENARLVTQARELRFSLDRELGNAVQVLQVLAQSHALGAADLASFYKEAAQTAERAGGFVLLLDPTDFAQILNTLVPFGAKLPRTGAPDVARQVVQERAPVVSDLFFGAVSRRWVYNVEVPVVLAGDVKYVLVMAFGAEHMLSLLQGRQAGTRQAAAVVDGSGRVIAHSTDHQQQVGQPAAVAWCTEGAVVLSEDVSGAEILTACSKLLTGRWMALISMPVSEVREPYRRIWGWLLLIGGVFLALALLLAAFTTRFVSEPIRALSAAAARVGAGEVVAAETTALREANEVGRELAAASRLLADGRATDARLSAVTMASGEAIYSLSRQNVIETWNPAAEQLYGYTADEVVGQPVDLLVPEEYAAERRKMFARVLKGETVSFETVRRRKDGHQFVAAITVNPLHDWDGALTGFVLVTRDISARKARDEQILFLMRELSHRTKNLLAVVQSVARQTAKNAPTLEAFEERFGARLRAMAGTHDALVSRDWEGASLRQIVTSQLTAILPDAEGRCTTDGPEILLLPAAAESIGLALHELGVNAVKYGSLSSETGRVRIVWDLTDGGDERRFSMSWSEEGGPPIAPPSTRGFGHMVIKEMLEYRTGGSVAMMFPAEGFRWRLEAPTTRIVAPARSTIPHAWT
jgi:PAS domain S-box-containing protein